MSPRPFGVPGKAPSLMNRSWSSSLVIGLLLSTQRAVRIIRNLVFSCTLIVHHVHGFVIRRRFDDRKGLCAGTPRAPRSLAVCCHKTSSRKNLKFRLSGSYHRKDG